MRCHYVECISEHRSTWVNPGQRFRGLGGGTCSIGRVSSDFRSLSRVRVDACPLEIAGAVDLMNMEHTRLHENSRSWSRCECIRRLHAEKTPFSRPSALSLTTPTVYQCLRSANRTVLQTHYYVGREFVQAETFSPWKDVPLSHLFALFDCS